MRTTTDRKGRRWWERTGLMPWLACDSSCGLTGFFFGFDLAFFFGFGGGFGGGGSPCTLDDMLRAVKPVKKGAEECGDW